jgi:hypothetical protein
MTTKQHSSGIAVVDDNWVQGGSDKQAYISPWYVTNMKHRDIDNLQGVLSESTVAESIQRLQSYTPISKQ